MDTLSLRLRFRPLRIGWCLLEGDIVALRKALRFTHTMWGGRFNPIIPIGDFDLSSCLVRDFHVDILFPLSEHQEVQAFIKQFPYLSNPFLHSQPFVDVSYGLGMVSTTLDLSHPISRLYEQHFKNNPQPAFRTSLYEWSNDDPLADVLLATFGSFPSKEDTGTDYHGLIRRYLSGEQINIQGQEAIPSNAFRSITPNQICGLDLKHYYSRDNPGFYVGSATDFHDLIYYWNLRAADVDLLFYDPAFASRLDPLRAEYLAALRARPRRRVPLDNDIAIWSQRAHNELPLHEFGDGLSLYPPLAPEIGLNVHPPIFHFEEKSVLATVSQSFDNLSVSFALPEKPYLSSASRLHHQHFVVSIVERVWLSREERVTFTLPYIPELNEYYGRNCYFHPYSIRAEPEGIGIIIEVSKEDISLRALDVASLISQVFDMAGMRAQPSQPGLITMRLIQQLGGLQGCRVFKIAGARALIEEYKPDKSFTSNVAHQTIGKTWGRNAAEYEWLFIEPAPRDGKLTVEHVFTYMVNHSIFRVGLEFKCPNCALDFWLVLDEVRTETKCEYCGHAFNVTSQLKDRYCWRYRRSGIFGRDDHQEGGIPVALTLQQLDTALSSWEGKLYTTAMNIELASLPKGKCEIDFLILTRKIDHMHNMDHTVQIALGECKNRKEITENDVTNLRLVAEALENKGIQVFVIFSKLGEFTPEELRRCQAVNGRFSHRLILFTARELEPYDWRERIAQEFNISRYTNSFEDMVSVTKTVFYQQSH